MKLFVANIPYSVTRADLENFFAPRKVLDLKIILDRETGRPRGFAFVEMSDEDGQSAIFECHGTELKDRKIVVTKAEDKKGNARQTR